MFSENPWVKTQKRTREHGEPQDFLGFSILRYVGVFCVSLQMLGVCFLSFCFIFVKSIVVYLKLGSRLTYFLSFSFILLRSIVVYLKSGSRLTFFLIFLHFLQKYRCVPKIGFSADIPINILIDEEEGRSVSEGVDLFLKSNNPTPK